MTVRRIVANLATGKPAEVARFYRELFDLEVVMDHGWILTLASGEQAQAQISLASEGGSDAPVPDLSIEVDNLDEVHERARTAGHAIAYPLTAEPWDVRRFFLRDPLGTLVNVLEHA
ncbi:VOC family protein [Pseudomonas nitroreducens]|uniref:VOC family protein n=1 Tax=Pseudomonas nitroreducens TaxID=46680 RepID=UPI00265B36C6|nr:VOC family protein [Pseudomonas nitroreducens]MCP1650192.1 catechol 2,3-dioxygenase-like lactoylglutathione lyase family enzyme [Pseudomonas nitroreducens]MCP1687938.1 catechol 2,3-dioxygenase-like lactoylglutathione lyase family enzyme [Pseudomonas nitroreducens]